MNKNIYLSGRYAEDHPTYHVEDSAWKAGQILAMIDQHRLQPLSICEVGCGAGEVLAQLQRRCPAHVQFSGYEISPQALQLCRQRQNERLRFYDEDLLSKNVARYDVVLCIDVFEHVEDYLGFLRKLRDKGKCIIFHIPLDLSVQMVWRCAPILSVRKSAGHLHYFMKDTALATVQDAGYEIVDWFYTPSQLDRGKGLKPKLLKWPRKLLFGMNRDWAVRILGGYSLLVMARKAP